MYAVSFSMTYSGILAVLMQGRYGTYEYLVLDESSGLTMLFRKTLLPQI